MNLNIPVEVARSNKQPRLPAFSIDQFGYSKSNALNPAGILKMLDNYNTPEDSAPKSILKGEICLTWDLRQSYIDLIDSLPSEDYAMILIDNYFVEYNWHYSLVDHNLFMNQLGIFYLALAAIKSGAQARFAADVLYFPALMFELIALSLRFLPLTYDRKLDVLLNGRSATEWSKDYNNASAAIQDLLGKQSAGLISIQASFLRVVWLKVNSQITESWLALGEVVREAEDMGLHREGGAREFASAEDACNHAWSEEIRRRFMVNLFLWDRSGFNYSLSVCIALADNLYSGMAVVLGKPAHTKFESLSTLPTDTHIPRNRKTTIPLPRNDSQKPDTFTMRLLEYGIQKNLPKIRQLEEDGPYPRDYARVKRLHQCAVDYIEALPAIFNLQNPDKSFDMECPWLIPQREYLHSTTWFYIIAIHRPYIFSMRKSRYEIIKSGIEVLKAQQRFFNALEVHQFKQFTLAYLTFEAAVTTLAVLIAYPAENRELLPEAFRCLYETIRRFQRLSSENSLASSGLAIIQTLVARAESVRNVAVPPWESKSHLSIDGVPTPTLSHESGSIELLDKNAHGQSDLVSGLSNIHSDSTASVYSCLSQPSNANLPLPGTQPVPAYDPSFKAMDCRDDTDFGYLISPLVPTADLLYHEIVARLDQNADVLQVDHPQSIAGTDPWDGNVLVSLGQSPESLPPRFNGLFPDHTFWGFINQGL
jgi:hypothetical protein